MQTIRDRLQVPKDYPFISTELSQTFTANSKKNYDPAKLRSKGGKRKLSLHGKAVNRAKLDAMPESERKYQRARASAANANRTELLTQQYEIEHPCIICGNIFTRITYHATICSRECNKKRAQLHHNPDHSTQRIWKPCKNCGKQFWGHQITCSVTCRHANMSNQAKQRIDHLQFIQVKRLEKQADKPNPGCTEPDCTGLHRALGLCSKHYQQQKIQKRQKLDTLAQTG